jgi:hypothetical protein
MLIEFGVAACTHSSGADVKYLLKERFSTYDEAHQYAESYHDICMPTIYVIVDNKYAFYCERSAVVNEPYKIYSLENIEGGQIEIRIWWKDFIKQPQSFLHLSAGIINN